MDHLPFVVLQPDYFAKGYEYFSNGIPPKTQEELDTLEAYGGEMVFTPGDIVYSSSALIDLTASSSNSWNDPAEIAVTPGSSHSRRTSGSSA